MQLNPMLTFNGKCKEAFKFYEQCLGGKIVAMFTHAGTPAAEHVPAEWQSKIMHVCLKVGDSLLMGSDAPPDKSQAAKGFSVNIAVEEPAEAERIFHALAENGTIRMPIGPTFWAARFGMLHDQFGIPWMVNCEGGVKYE
jgi:PhnB protein